MAERVDVVVVRRIRLRRPCGVVGLSDEVSVWLGKRHRFLKAPSKIIVDMYLEELLTDLSREHSKGLIIVSLLYLALSGIDLAENLALGLSEDHFEGIL